MKNKSNNSNYSVFDFSVGANGSGAKIEIYSNKQAVIDGCKGVIDYTSESVTLNCGNGTVLFLGSDFSISSYLENGLVLTGNISSLEFNM